MVFTPRPANCLLDPIKKRLTLLAHLTPFAMVVA